MLCGKLIDPATGRRGLYLRSGRDDASPSATGSEQKGVDKKKIHFELFHTREGAPQELSADGTSTGSSPANPETGSGKTSARNLAKAAGVGEKMSKVTIRLDGASFDFDLAYDGEAILDAANRRGADLPYACKGGVCCTCRARLKEGKVEMEVNYALEADELAAGFILACQSHPRSEKVVIDFDTK